MNVLELLRCWPVLDAHNLYWVHVSHPLFKDYPQVIDLRNMEKTLLQLEVQVMFSCQGEDVTHSCSVILVVGTSSNGYVVHVNANGNIKELMLSYDRVKDVIHHHLEGSGGVSETKKHDSWLVEAVTHLEGSFVFVSFLDVNIVISLANVQHCINISASQVCDTGWKSCFYC